MIFIHIPKTGGTSFRTGANRYFGAGHVLQDYGRDVRATSPLVNRLIHQQRDFDTFRKRVDRLRIHFLVGHFPAERYLPYFDKGTFVAFVRDPVQRVVSEYKHAVRVNGLKGSLRAFCRRPRQINRQWKFLRGIGIDDMAFVGLTEAYEASLERINAIFHTDIPMLVKNVDRQKENGLHVLTPEEADLIRTLNQADVELYQKVKARLQAHSRQPRSDAVRKDRLLGNIGGVQDGKVFGWVVNQTREIPVEVSLYVNERCVGHTLANRYRPDLRGGGVKRSGCAGILFDLGQTVLEEGDVIEFRDRDTAKVIARKKVTKT